MSYILQIQEGSLAGPTGGAKPRLGAGPENSALGKTLLEHYKSSIQEN